MGVAWWVWLLVFLYCAPGVYCFVALLTNPISGLPEKGEESLRPRSRRFKPLMWPVAFVVVLVLWPTALLAELRR